MKHQTDVLIIGAGIAGLMAASQLVARGLTVTLLDKGRGVGGRMATRRIGPGRADHGAQFFTARHPSFVQRVDRWHSQDLVFPWSTGWSDGSLGQSPPDGHPRFAVHGGMTNLPKQVMVELKEQGGSLFTDTRVTALSVAGDGWHVSTERGEIWTSRAVVMTAPVPQGLALLDAGETRLTIDQRDALEHVRYAPCLCALIWVDGDVNLPSPGALQRPLHNIAWIADNQRKGISSEAAILTLHGEPSWSAANFTASDDGLQAYFRAELQPWLRATAHIHEVQLVRWRYALPVQLLPERFLRAEGVPPLYFGGDAFGAPRVEGAAISGLMMGQALADQIAGL